MVKRAARPIAGTARNTIHDFLFTETLIEAITSDPGFNTGFYASSADIREGLLRHSKIWAVMGWSTEFFQENRHKALGFSSLDDFIINFMYAYFSVMDPNNLLCMAWKWQRGDVSRHTGGDLRAALGRIKAKTFVMPMSSDMFFPPADCQAEWRLIPDAEFRPLIPMRSVNSISTSVSCLQLKFRCQGHRTAPLCVFRLFDGYPAMNNRSASPRNFGITGRGPQSTTRWSAIRRTTRAGSVGRHAGGISERRLSCLRLGSARLLYGSKS